MKEKQKYEYVALLRKPDKEYYLHYFAANSKREIYTLRKDPSHSIQAVFCKSKKNIARVEYMRDSLNRLNS